MKNDHIAQHYCRASIGEQVMQCYIYPNLMKKQTHLHLGRLEGEDMFSIFSLLGENFAINVILTGASYT